MSDLEAERTPTRTETVRRALEEDIFGGHLQPGDRLDEATLATRFSVSRTPVREALHQLSASGLVEVRPRRGAIVARITMHQLLETLEILAEMEGLCARFAAERMTGQELEALHRAHEACVAEARSARADDHYYECNRRFHELVWHAARNGTLLRTTRTLYQGAMPFGRFHLRETVQRKRSVDDHQAVLQALSARDPLAAQASMRRHVAVQAELLPHFLAALPHGPKPSGLA